MLHSPIETNTCVKLLEIFKFQSFNIYSFIHTVVPETQAIAHLVNKCSVMLMQSLGDMISARMPTHPRSAPTRQQVKLLKK